MIIANVKCPHCGEDNSTDFNQDYEVTRNEDDHHDIDCDHCEEPFIVILSIKVRAES